MYDEEDGLFIEMVNNQGFRTPIQYLSKLREIVGVKQKEVAKRMHRSSSCISNRENTSISWQRVYELVQYADTLDFDVVIEFRQRVKTDGKAEDGK